MNKCSINKHPIFILCTAILTTVFVGSCQKETEKSLNRSTIHFLGIEAEEQTKAVFGEKGIGGYPVLWEETDITAVTVDFSSQWEKASITPITDGKVGFFTATLPTPGSDVFSVQAVVPSSRVVSFNTDAKNITLNIPASQTPLATSPDPEAVLLAASEVLNAPATDEAIKLPFHHALAYGGISLTNLPTTAEVHSIDLIFDVPVTGKWDYDPSIQTMSVRKPANIITIHTAQTDKVFFACAPITETQLTIRLNSDEGMFEIAVHIPQMHKGILTTFSIDFTNAVKKEAVSILSFGNSFAVDGKQYLPSILKSMGLASTINGVDYGSCSLQKHVSQYNQGYDQYEKYALLEEQEWDYITLQQVSGSAGQPSTFYPYLDKLVDIIRTHQPKAKLFWHMTWAYAESNVPKNYDYMQLSMYDAILSVVQDVVIPPKYFGGIIPSGTVVQNLRASGLTDDLLTRDGYHMSKGLGRYAVGMEWARSITGMPVADITFGPSTVNHKETTLLIKEAVENAYRFPFLIISSEEQIIAPPELPGPPSTQEIDFDPIFNPSFPSGEEEWGDD